jgi:hypothetical protein
VEVGKKGVFYTNSLVSGESLVVKGIANFHPEHSTTAEAVVATQPDRLLDKQISGAQAVVVGTVVAIKEPNPRVLNGGSPKIRITEHAAFWREAVISVDSVEKGKLNGKSTFHVLFPESYDAAWRGCPKTRGLYEAEITR